MYSDITNIPVSKVEQVTPREKCGFAVLRVVSFSVMRRSVLGPTAKPSHTEAIVLCKVLGTLRTIFMKLIRVLLLN
jgi:hypothetical protein